MLPLALSLALFTGACASATVTHRPIRTEAEDLAETGLRYLGTSPYLIAYSNGKGGIVTQISYLPDPAKRMSAKPAGELADVEATMDFDRGVLTTSAETGDATAVPKAIVKAVETLAPRLLAALGKTDAPKQYEIPAPYVFKIVVRGPDVYFLGGGGDSPIRITLLPQDSR
jgi:hypothetical protein